jgi:hypothetical protein
MHDYRDCYAVLGVSPDAEWGALRAQYRRLIRQWHPDRFPADIGQRKIAEEQSKRITAAYQILDRYRRNHGALPRVAPRPVPPAPHRRARGEDAGSQRMPSKADGRAGPSGLERAVRTDGLLWRKRRAVLALCASIAALYLAHRYYADVEPRRDGQPVIAVPDPAARPVADGAQEPGGISLGSTIGEVYAVQGIPTQTAGDSWYYGKSQIRFSGGQVVSWHEDPGNPLRIARNQRAPVEPGNFKVGSTKDEVRAIQGNPVTETATVWDYGLSRVYFDGNRVVRWEESPIQALHVPHQGK